MIFSIMVIIAGVFSWYASNHHMEFGTPKSPLEQEPSSPTPTLEMPTFLYPTQQTPVVPTDDLWANTIPESMKDTTEHPTQP